MIPKLYTSQAAKSTPGVSSRISGLQTEDRFKYVSNNYVENNVPGPVHTSKVFFFVLYLFLEFGETKV